MRLDAQIILASRRFRRRSAGTFEAFRDGSGLTSANRMWRWRDYERPSISCYSYMSQIDHLFGKRSYRTIP